MLNASNGDIRVMKPWKPITFICFALCLMGIIASVVVISLITVYLSPKGEDLRRDPNNKATNPINMVFATDYKGNGDDTVADTSSLATQFNQQLNSRSYGLGVEGASFTPSTSSVAASGRRKRATGAPISCDTGTLDENLDTNTGDKMVTKAFLDKKLTTRCGIGLCNDKNLAAIQNKIQSKFSGKVMSLKVKLQDGTVTTVSAKFCSFGSVTPRAITSARRVDTHYHIVPDFYAKALSDAGGDPSGGPSPTWSVAQSLDHMDQLGIETAFVTVTAPGTKIYENENDTSNIQKGRDLARQINLFQQEMCDNYTKRFGSFAQLPALTDVEGALAEIAYVESTGKHNGYILFTSYGEEYHYLGTDIFEPIWAKFNELKSVVFIHPSHAPIPTANKYVIQPLVDYPQETTRTAADIVVSGMRAKYPNATVILSHAGGTLPYLAYRISMAGLVTNPTPPRNQQQILSDFKTFNYDTAISANSPQLKALLDFIDVSKITFGSDDCYVPIQVNLVIVQGFDTFFLENEATKNEATWQAITRGNAQRIFPNKIGA